MKFRITMKDPDLTVEIDIEAVTCTVLPAE